MTSLHTSLVILYPISPPDSFYIFNFFLDYTPHHSATIPHPGPSNQAWPARAPRAREPARPTLSFGGSAVSNLWKQIIRAIVAVLLQFLDLMDGPTDQKIARSIKQNLHHIGDIGDKTA
jgi:hypothetical protein